MLSGLNVQQGLFLIDLEMKMAEYVHPQQAVDPGRLRKIQHSDMHVGKILGAEAELLDAEHGAFGGAAGGIKNLWAHLGEARLLAQTAKGVLASGGHTGAGIDDELSVCGTV